MANKIIRKEWTTRGADPTTVVTYRWNDVEITEFQNVYVVMVGGVQRDDLVSLGTKIHQVLETEYWFVMTEQESEGNYDHLFHGGM